MSSLPALAFETPTARLNLTDGVPSAWIFVWFFWYAIVSVD
jgi:hypothetical protein